MTCRKRLTWNSAVCGGCPALHDACPYWSEASQGEEGSLQGWHGGGLSRRVGSQWLVAFVAAACCAAWQCGSPLSPPDQTLEMTWTTAVDLNHANTVVSDEIKCSRCTRLLCKTMYQIYIDPL